jgi:hypothetical protein
MAQPENPGNLRCQEQGLPVKNKNRFRNALKKCARNDFY